MTPAMTGPGDITDEFDDDALRASIERADTAGEWRDTAGFVDPKLAAIEKKLAEPEPANADYAERRRRELLERASMQLVDGEPEAKPKKLQDPFAGDWREALAVRIDPPAATPAPAETPPPAEPSYLAQRRSAHPVLTTIRPLLTGFGVFLPAAAAYVLIAGWHYDVALRTAIAAPLAGFLWQQLDAERFRALVLGAAVHLLAFFLTSLTWTVADVVGHCTAFVIVAIGALVVGSIHESRKMLADRH